MANRISLSQIYPSLLSADPLRLNEEIEALIEAGIQTIHLDIMDNHYVPNLSFGPQLAKALVKQYPHLIIDVHLMVSPTDTLITAFASEGVHRISIHPEATEHLERSLQLIKQFDCKAGLALNPATDLHTLKWVAHLLDFVLIMTVSPGFSGQCFIPEMLPKIQSLHTLYRNLEISVDGGVQPDKLQTLSSHGASSFVIGSALFQQRPLATHLHAFLSSCAF